MHARKQIRDYVVAHLMGLSATGSRVYAGRTRPLPQGYQPTLLVYTRNETSSRAVHGRPPILERQVTLHIEGRVTTSEPPDDLLDEIASQVEAAMGGMTNYATGQMLGGLVQNIRFTATEMIAEAPGETHIGGIRLEYLVIYRTAEGQPNAIAGTQGD